MDIPKLFPREPDTHKNDYGRVFVLGGSSGMAGAAFLAAEAALRSGAGYVRLGMPWRLAAVAASNPNLMCILTVGLPETEEGSLGLMAKGKIAQAAEGYDVAAIGPGLSRNAQTQQMLSQLLPELPHALVLDADALYCLGKHSDIISELRRDKGLPILTPHPGEFAHLRGVDRPSLEPQVRMNECRDYAAKHGVVCALKGYRTVVSDGERTSINQTGNPGMATAGSGDVLTGVIAALRGQGYDSFEATVLGVYLHGMAGDLAAERKGQWGMTAHDILDNLPAAFLKHFHDSPPDSGKDNSVDRRKF